MFIIVFFGCFTTIAQSEKIALKTYSFSEIENLHQQKPKPIVAFIYTDWCKFCYVMKQNTFKNDEIIKNLNDHFYFVLLNAEDKNSITFLGKTFNYKPSGNKTGLHELANELAFMNGKISYPTTTILNKNFTIDVQIPNYISSKKMKSVLKKYLEVTEN